MGLLHTTLSNKSWDILTLKLSTIPDDDKQQLLLLVTVKLCGQLQGPKSQEIADRKKYSRPKAFHTLRHTLLGRIHCWQGAWVAYETRGIAQLKGE